MMHTVRDTRPSADVFDVEVEMHLFQLLRDGGFHTARDLLAAAQKDFPDMPIERLKSCAARLAQRMLDDKEWASR